MKGKNKTVSNSFVPIIAVLAVIFGIILAVGNKPVDKVKGLEYKSGENSVSLSWKPVNKADGYIIYQKDAATGEFKEIMDQASSGTGYAVKPLEQAQKYEFNVRAYRKVGKTIKESDKDSLITAYTAPEMVEIGSVTYVDKGLAEVNWTKNDKAAGYEIQYAKDINFKNADEITAEAADTIATVKELDKDSGYYFRVRSFIVVDEEKIYSGWSPAQDIISYEEFERAPKVDPDKPMIALTFDDGPGYNSASDKILDVLEKYHARATFFMVGTNAKDHPKNLKRKVELGCELGNHSYAHNHYGAKVTKEDIKKCSDAIYDVCGKRPTCFRSPGGETTQMIKDECRAENMALYYWSVDTNDWKSRDANKVYNHVMNYAGDGDIVLMHEIYGSTADAVEKIVPELISQGYQLVTVSELVQAKTGNPAVAGNEYITATRIKSAS